MKSIKYKYLFTILGAAAFMLTAPSCKKYLDVNTDPNNSLVTKPGLELTTSELYMADAIGDQAFIFTSDWSQYWTGGPGVALGNFDKYTMSTSDGNQLFNNMYRGMSNLSYIVNKAGQPNYVPIAHILMAYQFQVAVDMFGNVPFTQALKGDINDGFITSPIYDNAQTVVYPGIDSLLTGAIAAIDSINSQLGRYNDPTLSVPGSDDLIYGGDFTEWNKFANSLLMKLYIREGTADAKAKFAALETSPTFDYIASNSDNSAITSYMDKAGGRNPLWTDLQSSLGNFYVGTQATINYLLNTDDPRIDYFFNPSNDGTHVGLKFGDIENSPPTNSYSEPNGAKVTTNGVLTGGIIYSPSSPVIFMSDWETYFLLAEAGALGWTADDPKANYDAAVTNNAAYLVTLDLNKPNPIFDTTVTDYLPSEIETYLSTPGQGAFDPSNPIKSIALQKWVSMDGLQPVESWIETRRYDNAAQPLFGSPGGLFQIPTQNTLGGSNFPSIIYYPQTEASLNKNFPGQHTLTDKVFWDK